MTRSSKRHGRRRPRGPEERKMSDAAAALARGFTDDLLVMAKAYNDGVTKLRARYIRQLAALDGVDLDNGWGVDLARMRWVQVPQQGAPTHGNE